MSNFELFDTVALLRDIPEHRLKRGDIGAIVEFWSPEAMIVEFFDASGKTKAVTTVRADDVRKLRRKEATARPRG